MEHFRTSQSNRATTLKPPPPPLRPRSLLPGRFSQKYNENVESIPVPASTLCPQCHRPTPPTANYCSNCGKKLNDPPLSTAIAAQVWIYAFSIFLPMICFLGVSRWPGVKYARSRDRKRKQIGFLAIALMAISTIVSYWLAFVWVNQLIQSLRNSLGNLGGF